MNDSETNIDYDENDMNDHDQNEHELTNEQLNDMIPSFAPLKYNNNNINNSNHGNNTNNNTNMNGNVNVVEDDSYVRIHVPSHRYNALIKSWMELYEPIVNNMKLLIRYNPKQRIIELKVNIPIYNYSSCI
jgi:hypothetical protein